ncbi:MAG: ATP-binding protein [Thermoleophilaceae bacterium]
MAGGEATSPAVHPGNRFRVSQWFAIATAVLSVVTVISAVAGVVAILRLTDARELVVERLDPASTAAFRLSTALIDEEAGVRGYALAGDEAFLRPFGSGRRQEASAIRTLRRLVAAPELRMVADDLGAAVAAARTWRSQYARPAIARIRSAGARSLDPATVRNGRQLFANVRAALGRQRATIRSERAAARRRLGDAATFLYSAFGIIAILVGAALITAMIMLRQTVTLPIGALARRVRRVANGAFDRPVHSRGPRDIAQLAGDIDSMRLRILADLSAVREAHAQLDESARDLERSNAELEQFAYVASHDLQEPLRKVASFCQLLQQRYEGQLDERADQYIEFAVDGAKRMQQLINDLLAFSRVDRTAGDLRPVELDDAVRQALIDLSAAVDESGAVTEVGELPTVAGDRTLLALVFQNLIGNAIKFRSTAPPAVRIDAESNDGEWVISCSDNGIGIDPDYAERVFVIFQRLHPKNEYAGTGIGLAMCRKIVEYHGGRIWLDTDFTSGTTFRFTLPALEEDR